MAKRKTRWPEIGTIVKVTFDDHSIEDSPNGTYECVTIGEVFKVDKKTLVLRYWKCKDSGHGINDEFISLVKKAVTEIIELKEGNKY